MKFTSRYCIRIEGFPEETTVQKLSQVLAMGENRPKQEHYFHIPSQKLNEPKYAYLHNIQFEIYARNFVKKWHNNALFQGTYKLKCQIEYEQGQICPTTELTGNGIKSDEKILTVEADNGLLKDLYTTDSGYQPGQAKIKITWLS